MEMREKIPKGLATIERVAEMLHDSQAKAMQLVHDRKKCTVSKKLPPLRSS